MILTKGQWAYLDKRRDEIAEVLKYKPKNPFDGLLLRMEYDQLNTLAKLSNIAVQEKNDALARN